MLIVQKYGGSSVANAERIMNVAARIAQAYTLGNKMIIVLSAQGDTTDDLIEKAMEINDDPPKREMDMLLSTGEQQSVALMAMALRKIGCSAVSLNGTQAGIYSTSTYSNARIKRIDDERINAELDKNNIVIVTGFQGYNRNGNITTLGRGGSDTTAVAIAAAMHADVCEIYTDVDGVYTADPRVVASATKMETVSYDEMLELASLGAKVLHNRSVEMAKKYSVKLVVRSSMTSDPGTVIKEEVKVENTLIRGIAVDKQVARISIVGIKDKPGMAFRIFSLLSKKKITVDIIIQSIGRGSTKDISFTVSKTDLKEALKVLEENKETLYYDTISYDESIAKLSVIGAGIASNPGVASLMFEALFDAGVNISMITTSEIKISVLIDERDADKASNYIHDNFFDANMDLKK